MANRIAAFGTQLQMHDGVSSYNALAGLTTMDGPGGDTEELDGTAHDSPGGFRQTIASFRDPGELSFEGYYDPQDSTHDTATGVSGVWANAVERAWKLVMTDAGASEISFSGFVRNFQVQTPFDGLLGYSSAVRLAGLPTFP